MASMAARTARLGVAPSSRPEGQGPPTPDWPVQKAAMTPSPLSNCADGAGLGVLLAKLEPGWVTAPCKCLARPAARFWVGATLPFRTYSSQDGIPRPPPVWVLLCLPGRTGTRSMGSVITPAQEVVLRRAARVEGENREARPRC